MRFERRHHPLAPLGTYRRRLLAGLGLARSVLGISLAIGVAGYHWWGGLGWLDVLVNASMILGGMGPVDPITPPAGKVFASAYALFSGVALLTSVGVLFAPVVHRLLHAFHLEADADDASARPKRR